MTSRAVVDYFRRQTDRKPTMLVPKGSGVLCSYRKLQAISAIRRRPFAAKAYEPLRILFCGADEFSIASLKALNEEHLSRPDRIASIDVVCRPGKRVGRGLKQIREGNSHVSGLNSCWISLTFSSSDQGGCIEIVPPRS